MNSTFQRGLMVSLLMVLAANALAACGSLSLQSPTLAPSSQVAPAPTQAAKEPLTCNISYTRHEVPKPYQWDHGSSQPPHTLAPEEFGAALGELGILSACVPEGIGAPYLRLDSNAFSNTAVQGVMALYRFDEWPEGQLVYSTYDISMPTEYDKFATAADYEAMRNASAPGFERISVGLCYGRCTIYKTFVYPFADHYVAVTLDLGAYEYGNAVDEAVSRFNAGQYPPEMQASLQRFDTLVRGLQFESQ